MYQLSLLILSVIAITAERSYEYKLPVYVTGSFTDDITTSTTSTTPAIITSEDDSSTTDGSIIPANSDSEFSKDFVAFERSTRRSMDNMKRNLLSVLSSYTKSFHREVQKYMLLSPSNRTIEITKYTRDICDCDGARMSPCPLKCLYSCYGTHDVDLEYREDCRYSVFNKCECYRGANSSSCARGQSLENCYATTTTTETIIGDTQCATYKVDDRNISKSYEAISTVLIEPFITHFRGIDTELSYLRAAAVLVDDVRPLLTHMCQSTSSSSSSECADKVTAALSSEIDVYRQIKKNVTAELLGTHKLIRNAHKSFKRLKEEHFIPIVNSFKKYACCLKASNFSIPDFNCTEVMPPPPPPPTTTPTPPPTTTPPPTRYPLLFGGGCPTGYFKCKSGSCHQWMNLCDGISHCTDNEDEANCTAYRRDRYG